jgi:hypothetical protein
VVRPGISVARWSFSDLAASGDFNQIFGDFLLAAPVHGLLRPKSFEGLNAGLEGNYFTAGAA